MTIRSANDTPPEIVDVLVDRWQRMAPYERALLADQLSIDVATLAIAGIRSQTPGIGDAEVAHELARRRYGAQLANEAFGTTSA